MYNVGIPTQVCIYELIGEKKESVGCGALPLGDFGQITLSHEEGIRVQDLDFLLELLSDLPGVFVVCTLLYHVFNVVGLQPVLLTILLL